MKDRLMHWPSTALGLVAGAAWLLNQVHSSMQCQVDWAEWRSWVPAVGVAIWGVLIKGGAK